MYLRARREGCLDLLVFGALNEWFDYGTCCTYKRKIWCMLSKTLGGIVRHPVGQIWNWCQLMSHGKVGWAFKSEPYYLKFKAFTVNMAAESQCASEELDARFILVPFPTQGLVLVCLLRASGSEVPKRDTESMISPSQGQLHDLYWRSEGIYSGSLPALIQTYQYLKYGAWLVPDLYQHGPIRPRIL